MKIFILAIFLILISPIPTSSQSDAVRPMETPQEESTPNGELRIRRHRINLSVSSLDDVKVREGDRVEAGDLISDRTEQRLALETQKQRLNNAIQQLEMMAESETKPPSESLELYALKVEQAKAKIFYLEQSQPLSEMREPFAGGIYEKSFFPNSFQEKQEYSFRLFQARAELTEAIAAYEVARLETENNRAKFAQEAEQRAIQARTQQQQLYQQLAQIDERLEAIGSVRSPFKGRIRAVRMTGQSDRTINVQVTINPDEDESTETN